MMDPLAGFLPIMAGRLLEQSQMDALAVRHGAIPPQVAGAGFDRNAQYLAFRDVLFAARDQFQGMEAAPHGRLRFSLGRRQPLAALLVDCGEEGELPQHLAAGVGVEVEETDVVAPHPPQRFGLRLPEERPDPFQMGHSGHQQDPLMALRQLLEAKGHATFAAKIFTLGRDTIHSHTIFAVVGPQPDALDGIGIRQCFMYRRIVVQVHVDEMQRNGMFQSATGRLDQRIGRLHQQVDGLGIGSRFSRGATGRCVVAQDGDLRQAPDGLNKVCFQRSWEFDSDTVWPKLLYGLARQVGEFHPVMQNRQGVDGAECLHMQTVWHSSRIRCSAAAQRLRSGNPCPAAARNTWPDLPR